MRRRRLRRCLAVSTVVGNMLMILITLSLAAILVAWAGTTYGSFTGGAQLFFVQRGQALQERLVVEEVFFVCPTAPTPNVCSSYLSAARSGYADMFVRNVGVEQLNVAAIYINGVSTAPDSVVKAPCTGNSDHSVTLYVGTADPSHPNVCEFQATISGGWSGGTVFTILVATSRGNQVTQTTRAP